jgi:hypothetical protein
MVMTDKALTGRYIGSDTSSDWLGIVKFLLPLNVTRLRVFVNISEVPMESFTPGTGCATVTAEMGRSSGPNAFERRMRMISASRDRRIVCRMVVFAKTYSDPFYTSASARFWVFPT